MTECEHCGVDTFTQPPRESGCNHAHYPEACDICTKRIQDNCEHRYITYCNKCGKK